jgi:UDP-glucose 4-epimerase
MILIFGATGSIGAYLCASLAKTSLEKVLAIGYRKTDNGFFKDYGIQYLPINISDANAFTHLPSNNVDVIVHLAGAMPARMEGYDPQAYVDTNITGTLNILKFAERAKVKKIVYAQSISDVDYLCGSQSLISSDAPSRFPLNNDHSIYSISKNTAIDFIKHYAERNNFSYYFLRLPNIYLFQPNAYYYVDGKKKMQSYRFLIEQAMKGVSLEVWGNPKRKRDIVYVKDCVQIIENAITTKAATSGYYNVGTGIGTTIDEQIKGIVDVFSPDKLNHKIIYCPDRPDTPQYIFDISKTVKELNYSPQYDYISYLRDFKDEMEKNRFEKLWNAPISN